MVSRGWVAVACQQYKSKIMLWNCILTFTNLRQLILKDYRESPPEQP